MFRFRGVLPEAGPLRLLGAATLVSAVGVGAFAASSAVFFTRSVGLSAAQVGTGMAIAGVLGVVGSVLSGKLADRLGAREVFVGLALAQAALFAAYTVVGSFAAFLVVVCALTFAERSGGVVRNAVIAALTDRGERVRFKAYLRSVFNAGVSLGALAAAIPLQLDTRGAYVGLVLANAGAAVLSGVLVSRLPRVVPVRRPPEIARWAALRDRPFVAVAVLSGLIATHHSLLVVAVPIWVVSHTDAPRSLVAALFLLNTVLAIALQVWASKDAETVAGAAVVARRGAVVLLPACALVAMAEFVPALPAAGLLVAGVALFTLGELWTSAASWGLSFELASPHAQGQYQGVFSLGMSAEAVAGPVLATAVVLALGAAGWILAGVLLLLLGLAMPATARWAQRTRGAAVPAPDALATVAN